MICRIKGFRLILPFIAFSPDDHGVKYGLQTFSKLCQRVFHPRRNLGVDFAVDKAAGLHGAELGGQHLVQYLATVGRDGGAKCRPFMFAGELDGKLWFCTNNTKNVYKEIKENPEIEISVSSPEYAWICLHGRAVFENSMAAKEMCMQNPIVKGQYGDAANPIFEVFYLDNAHGVIADFSGNPPYEF